MTVTASAMTGFLDLPLEIRNDIYKLALITENDVIMPVLNKLELYVEEDININMAISRWVKDELGFGLLAASKVISQEVKPIFYGGNTWYFSAETLVRHRDTTTYNLREPYKSNLQFFRKISMRFDRRDIREAEITWERTWTHMPQFLTKRSKNARKYNAQLAVWAQLIDALAQMPLTTLDLDLWNCSITEDRSYSRETLMNRLLCDTTLLGSFATSEAFKTHSSGQEFLPMTETLKVFRRRRTAEQPHRSRPIINCGHHLSLNEHEIVHKMHFVCAYCAPMLNMNEIQKQSWVEEYKDFAKERCPEFRPPALEHETQ